jgi:FemAB-related protein (PEP-CTERM system-associated)
MQIREMRDGEEDRWNHFVRGCETSTPQHLSAWKKVMERVFKSKLHFLLAEENGNITGVLPLIHVKSLVAGHYFTSFPGGLCASDERTASLLLDHVKGMVKAANASYLILRDGRKKWDLPELVTDEEHVTFLIEIKSNLDHVKRAMKKDTRQHINKASKNGLFATLGLEHLPQYYPIYSRAMHALGTPTLGIDFFQCMASLLPKNTDLITLYYADRVVGGGFISPFEEKVYCSWSGLLQEHYNLSTSYLLAWEAIKYAHKNEHRWVDLGRCQKNSGGYEFKKQFGGSCQQLYQQFYLNGIDLPPNVGSEMKDDPKFRIFINVWRKLPQRLTEVLGPELRKQMPFG